MKYMLENPSVNLEKGLCYLSCQGLSFKKPRAGRKSSGVISSDLAGYAVGCLSPSSIWNIAGSIKSQRLWISSRSTNSL